MRTLVGIVAGIFILQGIWIAEGSISNLQYLYGMLEVANGLCIGYICVNFRKFQNLNWRERWFKRLKGYPTR